MGSCASTLGSTASTSAPCARASATARSNSFLLKPPVRALPHRARMWGVAMGSLSNSGNLALHLLHRALDELADLLQPLGRLRLEAKHQDGLGVGGADEAPPVREGHPHTVHVHQRVARL